MVESITIMEYLTGRYGPPPLVPEPQSAEFVPHQQFLHLGEAGLAASMFFGVVSKILAPEPERDNWGARKAQAVFESRLGLVPAASPVRPTWPETVSRRPTSR